MHRGTALQHGTGKPWKAARAAWLLTALCLTAFSAGACSSAKRSGSTPPSSATATPATTSPATNTTTTAPTGADLGSYLPLYPFSSPGEVAQWQSSYRAGGNQPWHLDAGATAISFAGWLGYSNVNAVIMSVTDGTGAHVSVGFRPTSNSSVTSAIVHLVHWGSGPNVPWEVVGTDDTTFSMTTPTYGATVSSRLNVGGHITGVDENIRVQAKDLVASATVGTHCCLPSGGTNTAWSIPLSVSAPSGHVVTIAAQTGGHVAALERFTVTGVVAG